MYIRKVLFALMVSILVSGCSEGEVWYHGVWIVDDATTHEHMSEAQRSSMAGLAVALSKDIVFSVDGEQLTIRRGEESQVLPYEVSEQDDGTVILMTGEKDIQLGRDDVGVFLVGEEKTRLNDELVEDKTFNMYLMPAG